MKLCFYKAKKKNRSEIYCRFLQTIGLGSSKENSGTLLTSRPPQMQQRLLLSNFYLFYPFCFFVFFTYFYIFFKVRQRQLVSPIFTYYIRFLHVVTYYHIFSNSSKVASLSNVNIFYLTFPSQVVGFLSMFAIFISTVILTLDTLPYFQVDDAQSVLCFFNFFYDIFNIHAARG